MVVAQASHAKPAHLAPLTHAQRIEKFGSFHFTPAPTPLEPEHIVIAGRWTAENVVKVETPQLAHLGRRTLRMHRLAAEPLTALLQAWEAAGLIDRLLTVNGAFYPRYKRHHSGDSSNLSNHSWGTALDFNARWNLLGKQPAALGEPGSLVELVPIAESLGWAWGGFWHTPDGMHLELT